MSDSNPKPETTLVVILGASQFPQIELFEPNPAFEASAKAFKDYLLRSEGFGLPPENLLDLFNTPDPPSHIDRKIADFLKRRSQELKTAGKSFLDVLVYYVGHGGFTDDGNHVDYFLTLFDTSEQHKRSSGYLIQSLATTLKKFATHQRKYLILDCCFAAAAYGVFQGAPLQVVVKQTLDNFESTLKGTALLCAASKTEPAKSPLGHPYTMFSTALLQILNEGVENGSDGLTFRQLGELINIRIREIFDEAVRSEVHSPDQRQGDITRIPFFPNLCKKDQHDGNGPSEKEISKTRDKELLKEVDGSSQEIESILLKLKNLLSNQVWRGIAGVVAILALYIFIIQPSNPTPTPTVGVPPPTTSTPSISGNLAVPLISGLTSKVYLTGFDGQGINGPNPVSLDAQQPMFSQDGKFITVKATIDDKPGLYKLTASGFTPEAITNRGSAEWPVLSPDGKTVMFSESSLDYRLQKYDDGVIEEISLKEFSISAKNLLWSEDNQLVFQGCATWLKEPNTCGVWVTNVNNLDPRRIIENINAYPMSARGGSLAYMSQEDGDWEIYVMPLKGGSAAKLTNNNFEDGLPVISPDGSGIAYISNESGKWGLWTVNLNGQNKKREFDIDPGRGTIDTNQWNRERMGWRR